MHTSKLLIAGVLSACSCSVFAQWQWVDNTGRKVFSDRPPPAHIAPQQILKQPRGAASPAPEGVLYPSESGHAPQAATPVTPVTPVTPATPAAPATPEAAEPTAPAAANKAAAEAAAKEKAQEEAQRLAEEAERKKQAAQLAKAKQENCQSARSVQTTLQSGMRLAHVNDKGERGYMTEAQRDAQMQRAQKAIKENCS